MTTLALCYTEMINSAYNTYNMELHKGWKFCLLWNCRFPLVFLFTIAILGNHSISIINHIECDNYIMLEIIILCLNVSLNYAKLLIFYHFYIVYICMHHYQLYILIFFRKLIEDRGTGKGKPELIVQYYMD